MVEQVLNGGDPLFAKNGRGTGTDAFHILERGVEFKHEGQNI